MQDKLEKEIIEENRELEGLVGQIEDSTFDKKDLDN
jgi:hypothetical protein